MSQHRSNTPRHSERLTPWFQPAVTPIRVGVYEVKLDFVSSQRWYAYWDGQRFGWRSCADPEAAYNDRELPTGLPPLAEWRGLAEEPK